MTPKIATQQSDDESKVSTPNPIDIYVGSRLRLRRTLVGMSQEKLGQAIGLTFQQVQKYERGANRIGASRLFQLSQILGVAVAYFFDEMPKASAHAKVPGMAEESEPFEHAENQLDRRETLELVRAYYRIQDPKQRKKVFELIKTMSTLNEA